MSDIFKPKHATDRTVTPNKNVRIKTDIGVEDRNAKRRKEDRERQREFNRKMRQRIQSSSPTVFQTFPLQNVINTPEIDLETVTDDLGAIARQRYA